MLILGSSKGMDNFPDRQCMYLWLCVEDGG